MLFSFFFLLFSTPQDRDTHTYIIHIHTYQKNAPGFVDEDPPPYIIHTHLHTYIHTYIHPPPQKNAPRVVEEDLHVNVLSPILHFLQVRLAGREVHAHGAELFFSMLVCVC